MKVNDKHKRTRRKDVGVLMYMVFKPIEPYPKRDLVETHTRPCFLSKHRRREQSASRGQLDGTEQVIWHNG